MYNYFFIDSNGQKQGPLSIKELSNQKLSKSTLVWREGLAEWIEVEKLQELSLVFPPELPKYISKSDYVSKRVNIKKYKSVFFILIAIVTIPILIYFYFTYETNKQLAHLDELYKTKDSIDFQLAKKMALSEENPRAMHLLGIYYERNDMNESAKEIYEKASAMGFILSARNVALMVSLDSLENWHKINLKSLIEYEKISGDYIAQFYIGQALMKDKNFKTEKDLLTGFHYIEQSANSGFLKAKAELGVCYYNGSGVKEDNVKAFEIWNECAEKGNIFSMVNLGLLYFNGYGTETNYDFALRWFKAAAAKGNDQAEFLVGKMYYEGIGVVSDLDEAKKWLNSSSNKEYLPAKEYLQNIENNRIRVENFSYNNNTTKDSQYYCKWCRNMIYGDGYTISSVNGTDIHSGKNEDLLAAELGLRLLGIDEETDNTGDYCSKECATKALYSGKN